MAVARQRQPAPELIPLLMADNRVDPLWQQGRQDALQCAEAALKTEEAAGGGWGLLALLGGLVGVLVGGMR